MKAYSEKGSNHMKRIVKTKEILSLKNRESISQKLGFMPKSWGWELHPYSVEISPSKLHFFQ
jgi:hypothetical protein